METQQYKSLLNVCSVKDTVLRERWTDFNADYDEMPWDVLWETIGGCD